MNVVASCSCGYHKEDTSFFEEFQKGAGFCPGCGTNDGHANYIKRTIHWKQKEQKA